MSLLFPSVLGWRWGNFESRCLRYYLSNKSKIWISFLMLSVVSLGLHLITELLWGKWVLRHLKLRDALIYLLTGITALWELLLCGKSRWNWESQNPWGNCDRWAAHTYGVESGLAVFVGDCCSCSGSRTRPGTRKPNLQDPRILCTKVTFFIKIFGLQRHPSPYKI